jgi:hypothetical protein
MAIQFAAPVALERIRSFVPPGLNSEAFTSTPFDRWSFAHSIASPAIAELIRLERSETDR